MSSAENTKGPSLSARGKEKHEKKRAFRGVLPDSRTPLNFSQTFPTALNPRERSLDLQLQLTVQRARMDIELEKGTIMRSIAERREAANRMMENPRQFILDHDSREAEKRAGGYPAESQSRHRGGQRPQRSDESTDRTGVGKARTVTAGFGLGGGYGYAV